MSASKKPAKYVPEFTGPIEGWVVNFLVKNLWRVSRTMERDDVMQEAYVVFLRVKRTYPNVEGPSHFMALFKTSWTRHFNDLSTEDSDIRGAEVQSDLPERRDEDNAYTRSSMAYREPVGDLVNDGELQVMLRQAPREVTMVLNLLLKAPQEILDLALAGWRGKDRRMKAGGSETINRLLGLPAHYDVLQRVEDYFRDGRR